MSLVTGGAVALGKAIFNATDPITQIKTGLEELATAQENLDKSNSVIELANQYQQLREKTQDATLTSDELQAAQAELDEVRRQLSEATDGAISAEGEYNTELDNTVNTEKDLAEVERERLNIDIYSSLIDRANDYRNALEDQELIQANIERKEHRRAEAEDNLAEATAKATEELQKNGEVSRGTSKSVDMAADTAKMYSDQVNDLKSELSESEGVTEQYEQELVGLINDGYISAEEAAATLKISQEELAEIMDRVAKETENAENETEDLGDTSEGTADKLDEEAQAAEESADAIMDVAYAAVDARYAGGDLREAYEELSSELEGLREEGDKELIQLAEEQLALLDHAATVQELATSYAELGITSTGSLSDMATFLISTGTSVDEFASNVSSMRDSVVNSFQKIVDENSITASQMGSALSANLETMKQWGNDVKALWDQAYAEQDFAVMNYINYLAQTGGPEYAAAMREFASGGYEELKAQAYQWEEIGGLSVQYEANGMWANQYLAEQAASDVGYGAIDRYMGSYNSADTQSMGSESVERTIDGMKSQTSAVKTSAQQQTDAIMTIWTNAAPGFQSIGLSATQSIAGGLSSGQPYVTSAANLLAQAAKTAAGSISFYSVGYNMAQGIANGLYGGSSLIKSAAISVARSALSSAKSELGINSPSRVFRDEVGEMMGEGMALGLEDSMRRIEQAARLVSNNAYGAVARNMALSNAGSNMTNRQYTVSPTIYVYGAPGQDENVLAEKIMAKINTSLIRRSMS